MELEYAVIDVETTMKGPPGRTSHPKVADNYAPYLGVRHNGATSIHQAIAKNIHSYKPAFEHLPNLLVGHNLKFDLMYLNEMGVWWGDHRSVWDTQLAEYILTDQRTQWASLDDLAVKYGGTLKDDTVTKLFEQGVGADAIPYSVIAPYLENDLKNTEIVFLAQIVEAAKQAKLPLIMEMMDALLCTTVMQCNGVKVDEDVLEEAIDHYKIMRDRAARNAEARTNLLVDALTVPPELHERLNEWTSGQVLSAHLFGGEFKYETKEAAGFYKNGNPRTKVVTKTYSFAGYLNPKDFGAEAIGAKKNYYTTDEKVLSAIIAKKPGHACALLCEDILKYRDADKQYTTYLTRLKELLLGGYVYPSLNHCATITGRLSCGHPNLQNQSNEGPVRDCFVTRFPGGKLMDIDYNQLEMVGLAYISGCVALKNDLNNDVDMHTALFTELFHKAPTAKERKPFKRLSFGLVYGAGYKTLSENSGMSEDITKKFIKTFYNRYPGVKGFHDLMVSNAEFYGEPTAEMDGAHQIKRYTYRSPTGRTYSFRTYLNERFDYKEKKHTSKMTFSPTELKNYPIQGFSTGDIVPLVLAQVYRWWIRMTPSVRQFILPVLTVHDSIVFDVHPDYYAFAMEEIPYLMVQVKNYLEKLDIHDFDVTIKVGVSVGSSWGGCEEVKTVSSKEVLYA